MAAVPWMKTHPSLPDNPWGFNRKGVWAAHEQRRIAELNKAALKGAPPEEIPEGYAGLLDMVMGMIVTQPRDRMTIDQALEHRFWKTRS